MARDAGMLEGGGGLEVPAAPIAGDTLCIYMCVCVCANKHTLISTITYLKTYMQVVKLVVIVGKERVDGKLQRHTPRAAKNGTTLT